MSDKEVGYYFARVGGSDKIVVISYSGNEIKDESMKGVEILEKVPLDVVKHCKNGGNVLNLKNILSNSR